MSSMNRRYLLKAISQLKNKAHSQELDAASAAEEARKELLRCLESGGYARLNSHMILGSMHASEAEREAYKDIRIKLEVLIQEIEDRGSARAANSLAKFRGNVAALLDSLIVIDGEDSTCTLCNADLYENCGTHMEECPLPGIAEYAGIELPTPK